MYVLSRALKQQYCFSFLALIFLLGGCVSESQKSATIQNSKQSLSILPPELQKEHISVSEMLRFYENMDNKQRALALEHILNQANLATNEQAQAAYMLGRILQQSLNKQDELGSSKEKYEESRALFEKAKTFEPLKTIALWHITEIATIYGDEKLVRQALSEILNRSNDLTVLAAVQYAQAQSYLRANEIGKAIEVFKKIRADYSGTNYALGSAYYLGTAAYTKIEQEQKSKNDQKQSGIIVRDSVQAKAVLPYYIEYLQSSPSGRFATDILAKLNKFDNSLLKSQDLVIIANAYFSNGNYKTALNYWQRAGSDKYILEIADCLIRTGQVKAGEQELFQGIEKNPKDRRYLLLAKSVSERLNKVDALKFWGKLHASRLSNQDEIIWSLAIRSPLPQALAYYQQIITYYPTSIYAADSQWRLFWQRIKQSKGKSLEQVGTWCFAAAKKYSESKLAPRFLFWAGKISEMASKKEQAAQYYEQTQSLYKRDYYGQRAAFRYADIKNVHKDYYFELKPPAKNISQGWNWPEPKVAIENLQIKGKSTVQELIYLKQYDEALMQSPDLPVEIVSWLLGKRRQSMQAINAAAKKLQEVYLHKDADKLPDNNLLWQYSYPLIYEKEITRYSQGAGIADPLFLHALIREESRYEPRALSSVGALGLCQLMPATASSIAQNQGINIIASSQLYDPELNIKLGSLYLSGLFKMFEGNGLYAIASYNAGAGAVKNQLKSKQSSLVNDPDYFVEDFPFSETRDYIRKVFSSYYRYKDIYN